jgi:hypothetical protein
VKKGIIWIIATGILIRIFLAFSTFHSDIQPFYFAGETIAKGNVLNFYDYLGSLSPESPILAIYPTYLFNYPPLVYFFLGPINYLLALPFGGGLLHKFIFDLPGLLGNIQLNILLLTLKLPYFAFDLGVALLLYKLFDKPRNKFLALTLWIFNPINLYATYMMGQFDIIPTFLSVLALYIAIKKNSFFYAAFFLGLGTAFKIFPFLFLIPLALMKDKWFDRFKIVALGVLTYVLTILPFLASSGFRSTALVAGQTTKSMYATLPISGGESVILFPALLVFFYFVFLFKKIKAEKLWSRFFVLLLIFFIFTHYHPQWFIWITPFLIIDLVKSGLKHWPLVLLAVITWLGQVSFFDPGLSVWLFSPIKPELYGQPGIWESLGINYNLNMARSVLQTLFVAVAGYYIYHHFPKGSKV